MQKPRNLKISKRGEEGIKGPHSQEDGIMGVFGNLPCLICQDV